MSEFTELAKTVIGIAKDEKKKGTSPYDVQGEVKRIDREKNVAIVEFAGTGEQTPVKLTINAKKGDKVKVRVSGHTAWITGNMTSPPTDDSNVLHIVNRALEPVSNNIKTIEGDIEQAEKDIIELQGKEIERIAVEYCFATARTLQEGQEFDDIKVQGYDWDEEVPDYPSDLPSGTTYYYWRRYVIYCVDGTVIYTEPEFANDLQVSVEANSAAQDAADAAAAAQEAAESAASEASDAQNAAESAQTAAEGAQGAAEQARDEAVAEAQAATGIAEQAAADAQAASDAVTNQQKYFFHDNLGAHVSETPNSTATGAAANIGSNVVTLTKDNKLMASFGQDSLNFYDANASSLATLAAYTKSGITMFANGYRAMNLTNSALTLWDPTDTTNAGTANQRVEAIFSKTSANFYEENVLASSFSKASQNFYSGGNLAASFGADSVNFYDAGSTLKNLASYSKAGITFYSNGYRSTSITNSALTFWDPTDTTNAGTASQKMMALFSSSSAQFYADGKLTSSWGANAVNFYDGSYATARTADLMATYARSGIILYTNNVRTASFTPSGLTFWDPTDTSTSNQRAEAIFGTTGATFYSGGTDIASFGTTARVGAATSSRFLMNAASLQAYNSSNQKYFEATATDVFFSGNSTNASFRTHIDSNWYNYEDAQQASFSNKVATFTIPSSTVSFYLESAFNVQGESVANYATIKKTNSTTVKVTISDEYSGPNLAYARIVYVTSNYMYMTFGTYPSNPSSHIFSIGNGSSSESSNALTVDFDGTLRSKGLLVGTIYKELLEPSSDFNLYVSSSGAINTIWFKCTGNVCELTGVVKPKVSLPKSGDSGSTQYTICTIPSGYEPNAAIISVMQGSNRYIWTLQIKTDGTVTFSRYGDGTAYGTAGTSAWLPFHATWVI